MKTAASLLYVLLSIPNFIKLDVPEINNPNEFLFFSTRLKYLFTQILKTYRFMILNSRDAFSDFTLTIYIDSGNLFKSTEMVASSENLLIKSCPKRL